MSDTSTKCTCGGCGTDTTCCHDNTTLKASSSSGTYAYAAPDVQPDGTAPRTWPWIDNTDDTITFPFDPRKVLQEELLQDLPERVQKLEKTVKNLQQENLDLRASLDALVDIMDDTEAPAQENEPHDLFFQLMKRLLAEAETLLAQTNK